MTDKPDQSDFVVPSLIKRGHLKISVSTDSISHPLELAIVQRIEAMFVSEIDSYTLFLTRMKELVVGAAKEKAFAHQDSWQRLLSNLAESEEILHALQRRNFEEANHLARAMVAEMVNESGEYAVREE
jgi:precorrin-2 dehydrogenase/sirohydrochlorin ferrochelatase